MQLLLAAFVLEGLCLGQGQVRRHGGASVGAELVRVEGRLGPGRGDEGLIQGLVAERLLAGQELVLARLPLVHGDPNGLR